VPAGIPDFRSAGGLYKTLKADSLTCSPEHLALMRQDPTYCVSWRVFSENQLVYHEVRKPFILGLYEQKWKPSLAHYFMRMCQDKGLLSMVFSQNIDGLDISAGVEKVVAVHGSILKAECEFCKANYPFDKVKKHKILHDLI
jgi:NAD-dependent SIR2 family protein deacetylase